VGVGFQILQIIYSIIKRKENRSGDDPWNARTLEWSTATPPAEYVFATIPTVTARDQFWEDKKKKHGALFKPKYEDIWLPKNSGLGPIIGFLAMAFGVGIIWYMWWLVIASFVAIVIVVIIRLTSDDTEEKLTAAHVAKHELKRGTV